MIVTQAIEDSTLSNEGEASMRRRKKLDSNFKKENNNETYKRTPSSDYQRRNGTI